MGRGWGWWCGGGGDGGTEQHPSNNASYMRTYAFNFLPTRQNCSNTGLFNGNMRYNIPQDDLQGCVLQRRFGADS